MSERYHYNPYGERMILDGDWSADQDGQSDADVRLGHQGLFHDAETGLIQNRHRMLHTQLGRFTTRDPLGYVDGMSVYAGYHLMRAGLDPFGLEAVYFDLQVGSMNIEERWYARKNSVTGEFKPTSFPSDLRWQRTFDTNLATGFKASITTDTSGGEEWTIDTAGGSGYAPPGDSAIQLKNYTVTVDDDWWKKRGEKAVKADSAGQSQSHCVECAHIWGSQTYEDFADKRAAGSIVDKVPVPGSGWTKFVTKKIVSWGGNMAVSNLIQPGRHEFVFHAIMCADGNHYAEAFPLPTDESRVTLFKRWNMGRRDSARKGLWSFHRIRTWDVTNQTTISLPDSERVFHNRSEASMETYPHK